MINFTINDTMDLLEVALKRSVAWSMRNRFPEDEKDKMAAYSVQLLNKQRRYESHSRAFVTHFKIELNNLMDAKWARENETDQDENDYADFDYDSMNDQESVDSDAEGYLLPIDCAKIPQVSAISIEMDGGHCGLYNINEQSDDEDRASERSSDRLNSATRKRSFSSRSSSRRSRDATEDDADGGYGSLNRGGYKTTLVQELSDIKSRLVDLVDEIDNNVLSELEEDKIEAFTRRKNALVIKLDALIERTIRRVRSASPQVEGSETSLTNRLQTVKSECNSSFETSRDKSSTSSSRGVIRNKSESNIFADGYEEQVQVINYDCRRRSSENIGAKTIVCGVGNSSGSGESSEATTRIEVFQNLSNSYIFRNQPIDFGAMMRKYEENKSAATEEKSSSQVNQLMTNNVQHVPTSSSTSASSHTSSSSFL